MNTNTVHTTVYIDWPNKSEASLANKLLEQLLPLKDTAKHFVTQIFSQGAFDLGKAGKYNCFI